MQSGEFTLTVSLEGDKFVHSDDLSRLDEYCKFLAATACDAIDYKVMSLRYGSPHTVSPLLTDYHYLRSNLVWVVGECDYDVVSDDLSYLYGLLNQHYVDDLGCGARVLGVQVDRMSIYMRFGRGFV